jgi:hypothetical protein
MSEDLLQILQQQEERKQTPIPKHLVHRKSKEKQEQLMIEHDRWLQEMNYNPKSHQNDWDLE